MKQRPRIYYSDSQKALMWERWRQGATLHEIAGLFDRGHSSIHRILNETGGIPIAHAVNRTVPLTAARACQDRAGCVFLRRLMLRDCQG